MKKIFENILFLKSLSLRKLIWGYSLVFLVFSFLVFAIFSFNSLNSLKKKEISLINSNLLSSARAAREYILTNQRKIVLSIFKNHMDFSKVKCAYVSYLLYKDRQTLKGDSDCRNYSIENFLKYDVYFGLPSDKNLKAAVINVVIDNKLFGKVIRKELVFFLVIYFIFVVLMMVLIFILERVIHVRVKSYLRKVNDNIIGKEELGLAFLTHEKIGLHISMAIKDLRKKMTVYEEKVKEREKLENFKIWSSQLAHDIRSPLSALDVGMEDLSKLPEEKRLIIQSAVERIRDIANELLAKKKEVGKELQVHLLSVLIEELVSEKRMQYKKRKEVNLVTEFKPSSYDLFVQVVASDFKRVLSNLIDNAFESIEGAGEIKMTLQGNEKATLVIEDTGKGIPNEILPQLMQKGKTFGKEQGSGLGLFYAKETVESWKGTLRLESKLGKGTQVFLELPRALAPKWFVPALRLSLIKEVIVLDDDPSIHHLWDKRLKGPLHHFFTIEEFESWYAEGRPEDALYLMDYELAGEKESGLELIERLGLADQSVLVTSRSDEKSVREYCQKIGVKLLPKMLARFVPLKKIKELPAYDMVHIDDNALVRMAWSMKAKDQGMKLLSLASSTDFPEDLAKSTPIYIDSQLDETLRGEQFARSLHEKGFTELYLSTGSEKELFQHYSFLKGVIGKEWPRNL